MPPQPAPHDAHLAWAVHDLAVAIAEADVAMSAALRVTTGDYLAVKHVLLRPDELGPVELGRLLGMSSGSATALVDRLETAGHVVRRPHDRDRRRRVLTLSAATRDRIHRELARRAAEIADVAGDYDEDQRRLVSAFLVALAARHRAPGGR